MIFPSQDKSTIMPSDTEEKLHQDHTVVHIFIRSFNIIDIIKFKPSILSTYILFTIIRLFGYNRSTGIITVALLLSEFYEIRF